MSASPPPLPAANRQIPNNQLHELFGEVNVTAHADRLDVSATILLEPNKEGSQTGVALDGSASMRKALGQGWVYAEHYDKSVEERMLASGKAYMRDYDGMSVVQYHQNGWDELLKQGLLVKEPNMVASATSAASRP